MNTGRKKGKGALILGLLLLGAGLVLVFGRGAVAAAWLMRLWPVSLVFAGLAAVMGFAISRRPRSPVGGLLLLVVGVFFLIGRFNSNLDALQIYGRYWLVILAVFAGVELVRFYSHRPAEGPPPRLFTVWRLLVIGLLVVTGVLANRVAKSNPSMLSAVRLPGFLSEVRDSVIGETYTFADPAFDSADVRSGGRVTIINRYGNVRVTGGASRLRATLTKGVRAWSEDDARKIAEKIRLVVSPTPGGVEVGTNREEVGQQFTTNLEIEVPAGVALMIADSYGDVSVKDTEGDASIKLSYDGRAEVKGVAGNVVVGLTHSDADVSNVDGDVSITGAKIAHVAEVTGQVQVSGRNGRIELHQVSGEVRVDAPFSSINAKGLASPAQLKTEHAAIEVSDASDVTIEAPYSNVSADHVTGDLQISSSNGDIRLRSVGGDFTVRAQQCSVDAADLNGSVDIETSNGEVFIKNFSDSINVQTTYRNVTLVATSALVGNIDVENSHGEIKLVVPPSSRFRLEAASTGGQVRTNGFGELPQKALANLSATIGSDGPTVRLRTSYRKITVQSSGARQAHDRDIVSWAPDRSNKPACPSV